MNSGNNDDDDDDDDDDGNDDDDAWSGVFLELSIITVLSKKVHSL
jgi:hypothetical protein